MSKEMITRSLEELKKERGINKYKSTPTHFVEKLRKKHIKGEKLKNYLKQFICKRTASRLKQMYE